MQNGNLQLYALLVLIGIIAFARMELAPWLTPRSSTSSCSCRSLGIAAIIALPRGGTTSCAGCRSP